MLNSIQTKQVNKVKPNVNRPPIPDGVVVSPSSYNRWVLSLLSKPHFKLISLSQAAVSRVDEARPLAGCFAETLTLTVFKHIHVVSEQTEISLCSLCILHEQLWWNKMLLKTKFHYFETLQLELPASYVHICDQTLMNTFLFSFHLLTL